MGTLTVVAALVAALMCLVLVTAPLVRAVGGRATDGRDAPATLFGQARRLLPAGRAEWGRAMSSELDRIDGRWERWRFAGSSLLAVVLLPPGPARGRRLAAVGLWALIGSCAALAGFALVHYPALRTGRHVVPALVVLGVLLAACAVAGSVIIFRGTATAWSLGSAVLVAACWNAVGVATDLGAGPSVADVVLLLIGVVTVATGIARAARPGLTAAVAGPLVFLAWTATTLATAGGPYDSGLVRDFPGSGLPDLPTYAVSDGLGSAIALLLMVPLVTAVLGGGTAVVARALRQRRTASV